MGLLSFPTAVLLAIVVLVLIALLGALVFVGAIHLNGNRPNSEKEALLQGQVEDLQKEVKQARSD